MKTGGVATGATRKAQSVHLNHHHTLRLAYPSLRIGHVRLRYQYYVAFLPLFVGLHETQCAALDVVNGADHGIKRANDEICEA